jgi:hypothetical protein
VTFDQFLIPADAARVRRVLVKLASCDLHQFVLTGSLATGAHRVGLGQIPATRPLNDVDIAVGSFDSIPTTLGKNLLMRHIHPLAPEGKMLLQLVDPDERVRVDIFRACGATMARRQTLAFGKITLQVISLEDLAARLASLLMALEKGETVASKHAEDFKSLLPFVDPEGVESAWRDQRKLTDVATFKEASFRVENLIESRSNLLVVRKYSQDVNSICPRCEETGPFRLSAAMEIMSVLGYV